MPYIYNYILLCVYLCTTRHFTIFACITLHCYVPLADYLCMFIIIKMLGIIKSYSVKSNRHALYLYNMNSSWYIYIATYLFFSNDLTGAVPEYN